MQFKLAFAAAAFATLVVAQDCSTGPIQCCQETTTVADLSQSDAGLLEALGINLGTLTNLIGLQCTGILGGACASQAVCCQDNAVGGLLSIGCLPIQL